MSLKSFLLYAGTAWRIGLPNIARFMYYKGQIRLKSSALLPEARDIPSGPWFGGPSEASGTWPEAQIVSFDWLAETIPANAAPDWLRNPVTGKRHPGAGVPWHALPDFAADHDDIKCYWELSRFGWVFTHAVAHRHSGGQSLHRLNGWLSDWLTNNPPYTGPNWKCGQEASLRVLHLACAALVLDEWERPSPGLAGLVRLHLRRIAPTIHYAIAQDNNHGTSEAAALFVGGSWLARATGDAEAAEWERQGRYWLENRAARLIAVDGSFSQYSVNYHRLMLDTLSISERWRQLLALPAFSARFQQRARAATDWLFQMLAAQDGDAPVIGANDGARLLPLAARYRDHRPSVQLASALFDRTRVFAAPETDVLVNALALDPPEQQARTPQSRVFADGGYAILRQEPATCVVRFARFRFRPGHADALHLDLWVRDQNVLRDGGTYGYNAAVDDQRYFSGTASHNTVQFDDRDQMPRISRFLFGAWLKSPSPDPIRTLPDGTLSWGTGYSDAQGAAHARQLLLSSSGLVVTDVIAGFHEKAVLRWRLAPGVWTLENGTLTGPALSIAITSDKPLRSIRLAEGFESRHYLQKEAVPVLEVEAMEACTIKTTIGWPSA